MQDHAVEPRARPARRLPGRDRPVGLRAAAGDRVERRRADGRRAARLDDDAVDARLKRRRRGRPRADATCARTSATARSRSSREALVERVLGEDAEILETFPGRELVGTRYEPPFPYIPRSAYGPKGHTVLPADFVTADGRHRARPHRDRVRRGRLPARRAAGADGRQPGQARRHLRRADRPLRRALGQGRRPRPDRGPARAATACCAPSSTSTPTRTAGAAARRCSTTPSRRGTSRRARSRTGCWPPTRPSTGTRRTSSTGASATGSRATSTGRCRASATGARRCRSGAARTAARTVIGSLAELQELSGVALDGPAPAVRRRGHVPVRRTAASDDAARARR